MTPAAPEALRRLLADTDALLLDFDGPVCNVFAGLPALVVVDQLCVILADGGYGEPPPDVAKSNDPFDVLRYAATLGVDEARFVNAAFTAHEVEAVTTAVPTPGAHEFIHTWSNTGRALAVVSNNSTLSIKTYLDIHNLSAFVTFVSGRDTHDPALLKPDPYALNFALSEVQVLALNATMVGDSISDIEAAKAAKTRSIGYANKPGKVTQLAKKSPDLIVKSINDMTLALNARPDR